MCQELRRGTLERVEVAVGILSRGDGEVLLARRPPGKPLADYLEFPGGKLEPGEKPEQALLRELAEEIGVSVDAAGLEPLVRREHPYPDCIVRLHAYRVRHWRGEPVGREGQVLGWYPRQELPRLPLLPANRPLVNALALPGLLRVTPLLTGEGLPGFAPRLQRMLAGSAEEGIVVRLAGTQLLASLRAHIAPAPAAEGRLLLLNAGAACEPPAEFAGLHLPARVLRTLDSRPAVAGWIGASVHDLEEARRARELDLDYVIAGNVGATPSHPDRPPLGWAGFEEIALAAGLPAYAIGGLRPEDLAVARAHWGQGVAGIRAFWPEAG